jgi:hypothetical protein
MLTVGLTAPSAQTVITPDKNKYSPAEDVKIGQQAAQEVQRELPMLNDSRVDEYVEDIGDRLVEGIPEQFRHPEFRYSFEVVNQREINAFALPGGPMFINRGTIQASKSEGEIAGVMAHEIAHVALRHGTAQATKAQKFQIGAIAGQILGAIVGGAAGSVIAQGSNFGLGAYFLKYGREYERQADLLGAQIMARAGYDPRRMADMFRTIEQQGKGNGGPEWLSSHPNPGNRYEAINREAASLRIQGSAPSTAEFNNTQARLRQMSPAWTAEQIARGEARGETRRRTGSGDVARTGRRGTIEAPSTRFRNYTVGNFLRIAVPDNWEEIRGNNVVHYAPDGGFVEDGGRTSFTHGVEIGVTRSEQANLQRATDELLQGFAQSNPDLRRQGGYRRETIGGRQGLTATLTNTSDVTGEREVVTLSTVQLGDGNMMFLIGVAPESEFNRYQRVFATVRQNVQIAEPSR